jgi:hypothetical protein
VDADEAITKTGYTWVWLTCAAFFVVGLVVTLAGLAKDKAPIVEASEARGA